jgi:hypothetical protein
MVFIIAIPILGYISVLQCDFIVSLFIDSSEVCFITFQQCNVEMETPSYAKR